MTREPACYAVSEDGTVISGVVRKGHLVVSEVSCNGLRESTLLGEPARYRPIPLEELQAAGFRLQQTPPENTTG